MSTPTLSVPLRDVLPEVRIRLTGLRAWRWSLAFGMMLVRLGARITRCVEVSFEVDPR